MHSILKRSAALIASAATLLGGGMLMAGTAQADGIGLPVMTIHPAASTSYPKELVNGGFQTFGNRIVDKRSGGWQYLSFVDGNGMAMEGSSERPWAKVDGWDAVKFGWKSNDSVSGHRGIVEVQRFRTAVKGSTGNVWGEIAAATQGKYLYQDIDTANTSDAMYTVRLKHASRNKDARDSMQVLVGAPGREKPVTMRRTIANAGDKAGEESTTITSTGTGQDDQWDTYEGTVLVPRGQDVTRFTFKSVVDSNSAGRPDSAEGNLIDDVVFTKAYQLTYDANGGVKTRTSQIDYTTGGETRGKVKTVRDSPAPPAGQEKIVNGDFEYSGTGAGLSDSPFNYVSLSRKSYYYKDSRNVNHRVALPAGFDAKRFAWKSDQTGKDLGNPPYEQAGDVQVWNRYDGSNHYAELTAAQAGSAIYQDIDTESDSDVQPLVGPDLPVEASQPADAGHDGAVRTCQRMVDDDLETGRPLVGDGEPGSVAQRLVFAHEPSALLVPFAHVQRERPVLMFLVHDRLLFRNPRARCPGRAWWPRRFCVRSTMPRRSSSAPVCVVRRTRHGPRCARGGRARRPG